MSRMDPHSYFDTDQAHIRHLRLRWNVDFSALRLDGEAGLELHSPASGPLDLDTRGLEIRSVQTGAGTDIPYELAPEEPILGSRLRLDLPPGTRSLTIAYRTASGASALQWLTPEQTEGKRHPYLFSQCQAIHARSMVPVQDTPRVRVTYRAEITVPAPLAAVMSAGPAGERPGPAPGVRTLVFDMPQPIPPYLIALAVGHLESRELSPRSRVWAEPESVDAAAWEFDAVETMLQKAEELFGPYEWDRFDMLVLPPSFPYGGMENPRMTFLTPTLLAGDRSLIDVVAHELAHSWTGNLVTNATSEHFWLNEGFTMWAERRILEALRGTEASVLAWASGEKALQDAFERFGADSPLTRLRTELVGVDPDDVFSTIPYEKGSRFLTLIEHTVGRRRFDRFVREYIARFHFTSITTEEFIDFLEAHLPGTSERVQARRWLYEPGMADNAPVFRSPALEELTALAGRWGEGVRPAARQVSQWHPDELLVYLQHLPRPLDRAACAWLEANLQLTGRRNYEILVEWLTIAAASDYEPVFPRLREILTHVGRMKYLRALYTAMGRHPRTQALAREIFVTAGPTYHGLSRRVVQSILDKYAA